MITEWIPCVIVLLFPYIRDFFGRKGKGVNWWWWWWKVSRFLEFAINWSCVGDTQISGRRQWILNDESVNVQTQFCHYFPALQITISFVSPIFQLDRRVKENVIIKVFIMCFLLKHRNVHWLSDNTATGCKACTTNHVFLS